jgi:hypothetical protein
VEEVMALAIPIERMSFGVRFGPRYIVGDSAGEIIDQVLRANDTPFGPNVFSQSQVLPTMFRLSNPETPDQLVVSERDVMLSKVVQTRGMDEVLLLAKNFGKYIIEPVKESGARDVVRYGMVFHLAECSTQLAQPLPKHYLKDECPEARDLLVRFSKRLPTDEAHWRKGVRDYRNLIYTLQQDDEGAAAITLDYQEYFDPPLDGEDWKKKPFEKFAEGGVALADRSFAEWLEKLLLKDRAA